MPVLRGLRFARRVLYGLVERHCRYVAPATAALMDRKQVPGRRRDKPTNKPLNNDVIYALWHATQSQTVYISYTSDNIKYTR